MSAFLHFIAGVLWFILRTPQAILEGYMEIFETYPFRFMLLLSITHSTLFSLASPKAQLFFGMLLFADVAMFLTVFFYILFSKDERKKLVGEIGLGVLAINIAIGGLIGLILYYTEPFPFWTWL